MPRRHYPRRRAPRILPPPQALLAAAQAEQERRQRGRQRVRWDEIDFCCGNTRRDAALPQHQATALHVATVFGINPVWLLRARRSAPFARERTAG
jgi:hypothetical protein